MRRTLALLAPLCALALALPAAADKAPAKPKVLTVARPAGGEWMGLYLQGKKAGWAFSELGEGTFEGKPAVKLVSEVLLSATIGGAKTERRMREERYYEYKDGGLLVGIAIERTGDGGEEKITGRKKGDQLELTIQRPGRAAETRTQPASKEVVEQADAPRMALLRKAKLAGVALDGDELTDKGTSTTPAGEGEAVVAGVVFKVHKTVTVEEKDNLKVTTEIDPTGKVVDVLFGEPPVMVGKGEPEEVAKKLEEVDLFALTRVELDGAPPKEAFSTPGKLVMHVKGLPPAFQKPSPRQSYKPRPDGLTDVEITTRLPAQKAARPVPASSEELKETLKATLQVESEDPKIAALAKKLVGSEPDAWTAAQKLSHWVNQNMDKAYGASSDRATDVLARMKGDCTEHALLFTALARAAGIPARRIDGLVYMQTDKPALYWHEWAQVWVGEWIDIDPTFDEPVADATHLALGSEGKADSAALIGQLQIKVK